MEVGVVLAFDVSGLTSCPEGYALSGMYRYGCREIYCIEFFYCCKVLTELPGLFFMNFFASLSVSFFFVK